MPPKKGKKKGKPALGDWSDDDAVPGDDAVAAEQQPEPSAQAPLQQPKSKKLKGKKAKGKKVDWSDDDEVPAAPAAADEDASDAEVDAPRRSGSGSSHGAAGFSALPDEEDNDAAEGADPLEIGDDADPESDDGSEQVSCARCACYLHPTQHANVHVLCCDASNSKARRRLADMLMHADAGAHHRQDHKGVQASKGRPAEGVPGRHRQRRRILAGAKHKLHRGLAEPCMLPLLT